LFGPNAMYSFPGPGSYQVCLEIGGIGCSSIFCDSIFIPFPPSCQATLSVAAIGLGVNFSGMFQSSEGGPYEYRLYPGDGSFMDFTGNVMQYSFFHIFSGGGSYQACLRVRDTAQLCSDSVCINLQLASIPPGSSGVFIYVERDGLGCADCFVVACELDSSSGRWVTIDTLRVDSAGYYKTQLPYGTYLFRAEVDSSQLGFESLMPTYQGNVLYWSAGIPALLPTQEQSLYGCYVDTISLVSGIGSNGTSGVEGFIREGGGRAEGDPLGGVDILLLEINQLAIKRTKSRQNGSYSLTNLDAGTYLVYPEVINRVTYPVMIQLAQDSTMREVNLSVEQDIVFGGLDAVIQRESVKVFPNPTRESLNLSFGASESGMVLASMFDMKGGLVKKQWYPVTRGENTITISLATLESGTYLIRVQSGDSAGSFISVVKLP